jgi:hypothetical protein
LVVLDTGEVVKRYCHPQPYRQPLGCVVPDRYPGADEEAEMVAAYRAGEEGARDRLITAMIAFAHKVIIGRHPRHDVASVAYRRIIWVVDRLPDLEVEGRLSTYLAESIRNALRDLYEEEKQREARRTRKKETRGRPRKHEYLCDHDMQCVNCGRKILWVNGEPYRTTLVTARDRDNRDGRCEECDNIRPVGRVKRRRYRKMTCDPIPRNSGPLPRQRDWLLGWPPRPLYVESQTGKSGHWNWYASCVWPVEWSRVEREYGRPSFQCPEEEDYEWKRWSGIDLRAKWVWKPMPWVPVHPPISDWDQQHKRHSFAILGWSPLHDQRWPSDGNGIETPLDRLQGRWGRLLRRLDPGDEWLIVNHWGLLGHEEISIAKAAKRLGIHRGTADRRYNEAIELVWHLLYRCRIFIRVRDNSEIAPSIQVVRQCLRNLGIRA